MPFSLVTRTGESGACRRVFLETAPFCVLIFHVGSVFTSQDMLLQHCFRVFTNLEVNARKSSRGLVRLNPLIDHEILADGCRAMS